ncbi:NUDIX domain-containing protein [Acinetobacter terrestris]|jgi:8-oxo-dGTP diphosphatase|uniref:8-oxo-dGTP diphosphatase n=1 Tax=Acinetobacter terrestris TaxID=2529843 RepID=A0ABX1UVS3_9GAMM|nr:thiamine phosphate synthase [Acinetobacter terrestris]NNH25880.1 NUDIX domain-containing protein [Acinetobacter terrestris]
MSKPTIHVAIAILLHQDKVLVGWREAKQHQGNKHEFPGGKVEEGESPLAACRREIYEEVGIGLQDWHAFDVIRHEYDDVIVNLHLFHAIVPSALLNEIQQPWRWYSRDELLSLNFPKANQAMIKRLHWAHQIKISDRLNALDALKLDQLMYWRVEGTQAQIIEISGLSVEKLSKLIVNIELYQQLNSIQQQAISAIHLKQSQVMALMQGDLITGKRYIAACHDLVSMKQAEKVGCDAILLSPVLATETHPEARALGWEQFKNFAAQVEIPVFALGGMQTGDLLTAQQQGAYGIAGIRFL